MTQFDNHYNLFKSLVAVAPSTPTAGTTLTITTGDVAAYGLVAPFNVIVWPSGAQPTIANAEIVRVTSITGDQFTITRNTTTEPNNTFNRTIAIGDQIQLSDSVKLFTDLESAVNSALVPQRPTADFIVAANSQVLFGQDIDMQAANGDLIVNGLLQGVH